MLVYTARTQGLTNAVSERVDPKYMRVSGQKGCQKAISAAALDVLRMSRLGIALNPAANGNSRYAYHFSLQTKANC